MKRILFFTLPLLYFSSLAVATEVSEEKRRTFEDNFLTLGTSESEYGGDEFMKYDRGEISNQIKLQANPQKIKATWWENLYLKNTQTSRVDLK